jgi:hypothetical protein
VTGWLVTSFFAKPLLDFLNLRSQVLEELIFTANIDDETMPLYGTARDSLRRLGAKVLATNSTASWLLRRFLSKWGYELAGTGGNLIGLSNSLNLPGRSLHIDRIEKGLRLPSTYIPEFLDMVRNEIQQKS